MPYTLVKFLWWAIAFFGIGVLIGWLLRSLKARGEVAAARRATAAGGASDGRPAAEPAGDDAGPPVAPSGDGDDEVDADVDEDTAIELDVGEHDAPQVDAAEDEPEVDEPAIDLEAARAVLGAPIALDDLTVVDGIGPKIAELCAGVGIRTWRELADADPATLRSMLDDAGSRYRVHDPTTWSHQAELLADGRWSDFVAFHDDADDPS